MLPSDWQDRMIAMIRGAEPLSGEFFAGSHGLTPLEQIGIYREQYRLRMTDAVLEEIPGFYAMVGDETEAILWNYLDACPPRSWTLTQVTDRFTDWLKQQGAQTVQVEMAALDWAVMRAFEAADGTTPSPEDVQRCFAGEALQIGLQPHVRLLECTHSVHRFRSAVLSENEPPPIEEQSVCLAIYRVERGVRHVELMPEEFAILSALERGASLDEALEAGVAMTADEQAFAKQLSCWFKDFVSRGLIEFRSNG